MGKRVRVRTRAVRLLLTLLLFSSVAAWAQTAEDALLPVLTQKGAEAEGLAEFCAASNRSAIPTYAAALAGWRARNRWTVVQGWWEQRPELKTAFSDEKTRAITELKQHSFKSALRCGLLPQVLRSAEYDPSVKQARELAAMPEANPGQRAATPATAASEPATAAAAGPPAPPVETGSPQGRGSSRSAGATPADAGYVQGRNDSGAITAGSGAALPGDGQRLTAGEVTFAVPQGWTVTKNTADVTMLRQVTPREPPTVLLITSAALDGDVRQTLFRTIRAEFPGTGLELKYFRDGRTGGGLPSVYGGDVGKLRTGGSASIRAAGIGVGNRVVTVLMVNSGMVGHALDRQREMEAMVAGFTYQGEKGDHPWSVLHAPAGWGGASGLWMGTRMQNQLNPLGGMDLLAIREYAVLLPDGQAYFGLPPEGHVLDMDFASACTQRPKECGLYRLENGTIRIDHQGDYGMVTTETVPFHRQSAEASSFVEGGATLVQTKQVHGQRLSGNFTATSGMSGSIAGQSTSVFSQTYIRFEPQGTYQKSGFTTTSFSNTGAAGTANSRRGVQSGRYAIDGYTLTLTPETGSPEQYTIVFETIAESPGAVFIDDRAFLLEGGRR